MACAAGLRTRGRLVEDMKRRLRDEMHTSFQRRTANLETYEDAIVKAEASLKSKYPSKKQTSFKEIPVLPYGYKGKVPDWAFKELTKDYLPSTATFRELTNLFMQLSHHALGLASFAIPCAITKHRPSGKLPVTPMFPPELPDDIDMDDPAESSAQGAAKADSRKASKAGKTEISKKEKLMKRLAPPDAKMASKKPRQEKEEEVEEEKPKRDQDTYHIIRIYQRSSKRYLELLRQGSDGYIIAFRILDSLEDVLTAYWCIFSDFAYLRTALSFLNMRVLKYHSGYASLAGIYFGEGTIDTMIDEFLSILYKNPALSPSVTGRTYFHIICLVFGEAPRLEAPRNFIKSHIRTPNWECEKITRPDLKLGAVLNNLIQKWSNTGDTALYLLLVQLEKIILEDLGVSHSEAFSFKQLVEQLEVHKRIAHNRCVTSMMSFRSLFSLSKDKDNAGRHHMYSELALYQLLNEELHLVKHHSELVTSVILRQGKFRHELPGLKSEKNTIENEPIDSAEITFWNNFNSFVNMPERGPIDLINFLEEAIPFLTEFEAYDPLVYADVLAKCDTFYAARWNKGLTVNDAADKALSSGLELETWLPQIIDYLTTQRPNQNP